MTFKTTASFLLSILALPSCAPPGAGDRVAFSEGASRTAPSPGPRAPIVVADAIGYVELAALDAAGDAIEDPGGLLAAWSAYDLTSNAASAFALSPGITSEATSLIIDPAIQEDVLAGTDVLLDPEGRYTIVEVERSTQSCGETGIRAVSPDELITPSAPVTYNGRGICAPLTVAHSLVNHMSVVYEWWDGVEDGTFWDPDFLQAIVTAGGGDVTDGTLSVPQTGTAHTADWNSGVRVVESHPLTRFARDSCDQVQEHCENLIERKSYFDDCFLHLETVTRPPRGRAHMMSIRSVSFNSATCTCDIVNDDTSQHSPNKDYTGVPLQPGTQTWSISVAAIQTQGAKAFWWNRRGYQVAWYQCWDDQVVSSKLIGPGSAMPPPDEIDEPIFVPIE